MKRIFIVIITLIVLVPLNVLAETYTIDPANTTIQFKVRNMLVMNVRGTFDKFKGTVDIDETDITKSKADISIDAASINTGIDMRDKDLRSPNFFDVAKFPAMTFVTTKVEAGTADNLKVIGNLTIKGVTKEVTLTIVDPKRLLDGPKRGAIATATINRQDFGISKGAVISDTVFITVTTELVKQ
ncbi:MAG: YceI family protein [Desulfuromonadaceae bacterium]|nr:YceI family protein [Desulfuromonadaceae bacterium]